MTSHSDQNQLWPVWARASFLVALTGLTLGLTLVISGCYTAENGGSASAKMQADPDANAANPKGAAAKKMAEKAPVENEEKLAAEKAAADKAHEAILQREQYPSARACAECHPKHYQQWSISQHAYAQMSPVFNAMHGTLLKLTNGTNGDFCIRCHTPVGMNLKEPEFMSNIDRNPTSREGITCIVCHRLDKPYGKVSGRLAIVKGDLTKPIYGPRGHGENLNKAIKDGGLITDKHKAGRKVHTKIWKLPQLGTSGFCGTCHDVNLVNGFRLEEAFSEYKNAPAAKKGETCQDCHMGKEPGRILTAKSDPEFVRKNYDWGPAAVVGKIKFTRRKLTNHMFAGPDYSVLSPELFPLHPQAIREESEKDDVKATGHATIRDWIAFRKYIKEHPEHKDTWGTFDDEILEEDEENLPIPFSTPDDREIAREIVQENLTLLKFMERERLKVLRNGYQIGQIKTLDAGPDGIRFSIEVKSGTDGHNVPTGFDGERLVWIHAQVYDGTGKLIHESGDLDPNGDLRDLHSLYVHNHELPQDDQLFSLQSKFLVRLLRGGEREQVLPVPTSVTPLVFLRPERAPTVLTGRPGAARKHKVGIEPNGSRWATYTVKPSQLTGAGPYTATIKLKAAMIPVNLINEIRGVGFDYSMSARDVAERLAYGHVIRVKDKEGKEILERVIWRKPAEGAEIDPTRTVAVGGVYLHKDRIVEVQRLEDGLGQVRRKIDVAALTRQAKGDGEEAKEAGEALGKAFAEIWNLSERIGNVPLAELKKAPFEKVETYLAQPAANQVVGHQVLWQHELKFDVHAK
jgi:hypothetical protein